MADEQTEVVDTTDRDRYEIRLAGQLAGFAQYVRRGGRTFLVHTEIDSSFEGKGLGSKLAAGALAAEREAGTKVVPLCPFVRSYIDRHPDEMDNVDQALLARIDDE